MGEATWNHVYGRTASAGDSNKSMKLGGFRNDSSVMEENLMLRKVSLYFMPYFLLFYDCVFLPG